MAGYFIANYTITNQADYKEYLAAVRPILTAHGAENIVIDRDSELLEGSAGQVTVVLRFATKAAAKAWYESPEYPGHQAPPHGQRRGHRGHRRGQIARLQVEHPVTSARPARTWLFPCRAGRV